jgi:hypothetical protein
VLGWQPSVTFEQLIAMMVDADLARLSTGIAVPASPVHNGDDLELKEKIRQAGPDRHHRSRLRRAAARSGVRESGLRSDRLRRDPPRSTPSTRGTATSATCQRGRRLRRQGGQAEGDRRHVEAADMDAIDICVPTPLRKTRDPGSVLRHPRRRRRARPSQGPDSSSFSNRRPIPGRPTKWCSRRSKRAD